MNGVPAVTNNSIVTNTPATGAPTITGTAQVGQTLTAGTTAIMDADGLTSVSYTYQWIRTAAGVDTNISGATASTYTLVAADLGTTIKVRVSFTDDASNAETLTSAATAVVSAAPNTLPSASDGTVTTNEDTARTFAAADFNFLDTDPGDTLESVEIITLPASGTGTLALSGTPVTAGQEIAEADIGTLTYTPPANANGTGYASFTFKVSDGTAESAADYTMTITVTAVNDAPTVATAIPDQPATAGTAFSYAFPANTFSDADIGDTLTYAATKADGATLPAWLSFAAGTRTFSGTPQAADVGTVAVKVTASDGNGGSVSDTFDITVSADGDTTPPTLTSATVFEGGVFINLQFSENILQSNLPSTTTFTVTAAGSAVTVYNVLLAVAPAPLNAFWILVRPTIHQGQVVVVTYTDPTAGNDAYAIQNTAGNDAATFTTGMDGVPAVTNNSITNTLATGAPTITGTAQVGETLTATVGTIADANGLPDPFLADANTSFQWVQVNLGTETNIASATASTYTLVREDWAASVRVKVAFQDAQGNSEGPLTSSSVIIVKPANTAATGKPGITGTAQVGQTLTATVGTSADVDGLPNPFLTDVNTSFQWIRVATDNTETNIASATASTYTLVDADLGTTIKVKVGFADNYDYDEMLTSDATAVVSAAPNTPATGAPTITGTAQVGQTLTAGTAAIVDADGLTSVSYTYQWIRVATDNTETNISGATASTHTLVAADRGTTIKVKVSFTDDAQQPRDADQRGDGGRHRHHGPDDGHVRGLLVHGHGGRRGGDGHGGAERGAVGIGDDSADDGAPERRHGGGPRRHSGDRDVRDQPDGDDVHGDGDRRRGHGRRRERATRVRDAAGRVRAGRPPHGDGDAGRRRCEPDRELRHGAPHHRQGARERHRVASVHFFPEHQPVRAAERQSAAAGDDPAGGDAPWAARHRRTTRTDEAADP